MRQATRIPMTNSHGPYGPHVLTTRTQPRHGALPLRARARAGFSMVEVVVSLVVFLLLASVLALAIGRAFSAEGQLRSRTQASAILSDQLTKLSGVPYAALLTGRFTVPDPCPDAPAGIGGDSCVKAGASSLRISYGFSLDGSDRCEVADPRKFAAARGHVVLVGCVVGSGRAAFSTEPASDTAATARLTRQVNAPRPGFKAGAGTVRVHLSGAYDKLPGSMVLLVHPGGPGRATAQVAAGTVDETGVVSMSVDAGTCTTLDPCALALSVGATPTQAAGAGGTLVLADTAAAGSDAGFAVPVDAVTEVSARVAPLASAVLDVVVEKNGVRYPNTVPGSVCVWVSLPAGSSTATVPVCNTDDPGQLRLEGYEPGWEAFGKVSAADLGSALAQDDMRPRFPFPAATTLRVSTDRPDSTCPYAPGMVVSRPGDTAQLAGAPAGWAPGAACTSSTWGPPSRLELNDGTGVQRVGMGATGAPLTLRAGTALRGALVWDNETLSPGAVGRGADAAWSKPRDGQGCTTDSSCTSALNTLESSVADPAVGYPSTSYPNAACVADGTCRPALARVAPESVECPGEYCLSTVNALPALSAPATGTVKLDAAGKATFTIDVRDGDDAASSITAAVASAPSTMTVTLGAGTQVDDRTRRFPVTVTDSRGPGATQTVQLRLSSGSGGRARTVTEPLGLYYSTGAWRISGEVVNAKQGQSEVPVRVRVSGTDGNPFADASIDLATSVPGGSATGARTDASGYLLGTLTVPANAPAGTYAVTASVAGQALSGAVTVRVGASPSGLSVTVADESVAQGTRSRLVVSATDGAEQPVSGLVVSTVVSDSSGLPSSSAYPASTGCVTTSAGTCTVTLVVDADAPAGLYQVGASSGALSASGATFTVTAVPAKVTSGSGIEVPQGGQAPSVALLVSDAAGSPIPGADITVAATSPLQVTPTQGVTDDAGTLAVAITAPVGSKTGASSLSVRVSGRTFTVPVKVVASYGGISSSPTLVNQGSSGSLSVTVVSGSGEPVPATAVQFFVETPGVSVTPRGRTNATGVASTVVEVADSVPAGEYPVTVTVEGNMSTATLVVGAVPAAVTGTGAVSQGATSALALQLLDKAGDPIPGAGMSFSGLPSTMSVTPTSARTDADGTVSLTLTDTGSRAGVYQLVATVGAFTARVPVTVLPEPGTIQLGSGQVRLVAGSSVTLGLTVRDRAGDPLPGVTADVQGGPEGVEISVGGPSDAAGQSVATLRATGDSLGGSYPLLVEAGSLSTSVPMTLVGAYSSALLAASPTMLLPLDDNEASAEDLLGRHAGAYQGAGPFSFAKREPSTLPGSASASFQPVDASGTLSTANRAEIRISDPTSEVIPARGSLTISAWVKPRSIAGNRSPFALVAGNPLGAGGRGIAIGAGPSTTQLRVIVADGISSRSVYLTPPIGQRPTDWVGRFNHVAVVIDRTTNLATVWVNGQPSGNTMDLSGLTGTLSTGGDIVIGNAGGYLFDGWLDEVATFNRALGASELAALSAAARTADPYQGQMLGAGPAGYWPLESGSAASVPALVGAAGTSAAVDWAAPGLRPATTSAGLAPATSVVRLPSGNASASGDYTLLAWVNPTASSASSLPIASGTGGTTLSWSSTSVTASVPRTGGGASTLTSPALATGVWHQVALSVKGASTAAPSLTLYVDGRAVSGPVASPAPVALLGSQVTLGSRGVPARLSQVRVFDRALSAAEIAGENATTSAATR